jgi:hypothetical protein
MYTVLRFEHPGLPLAGITEIGRQINGIIEGLFDGVDKVENRFSCSISSNGDPDEHVHEIVAKLTRLHPLLSQLAPKKWEFEIDVALDSKSEHAYDTFSFPADFLGMLALVNCRLTITQYNG